MEKGPAHFRDLVVPARIRRVAFRMPGFDPERSCGYFPPGPNVQLEGAAAS